MAHALPGYNGLCRHIHGHSYQLEVTASGEPDNRPGHGGEGMVLDFAELKAIVQQEVIQPLDHALMLKGRIVIKNISLDAKSEVEIYHYSLITGFSPCFIDLKTDKTHKLICESSYISDMRVAGDTLIISLWKNHYHKLDTVGMNGLKIVIDTSGHQPNW